MRYLCALHILLLLSLPAEAGVVRNKIADACAELTSHDPDLTRNCVNHAELFEVDSQYIYAAAKFDRTVDVRMKALKSGATVETMKLCKSLRWNTDNTLSCMRSYPTPELIKECKKLSAREEEQLRCVREGRDTTQVQACNSMSEKTQERFQCLQLDVPGLATINCNNLHDNFKARMACMNVEVLAREEEFKRDQVAMQERIQAIKLDPTYGDSSLVVPGLHPSQRMPASEKKNSK
jgi:hypothetical protein